MATTHDTRNTRPPEDPTGHTGHTGQDIPLLPQAPVFEKSFEEWFRGSCVTDAEGHPLVVYHGTTQAFEAFESSATVDGGFHFGTFRQARMRASSQKERLVPAYLAITKPRRCTDTGGHWKAKIAAAKTARHDGIVYLNRYEGVTLESIERAEREGVSLDALTDQQFRRQVPEAHDSYIAFAAAQIMLTRKLDALLTRDQISPETDMSVADMSVVSPKMP